MKPESRTEPLDALCACLGTLISALGHETNGDHWAGCLRGFLNEGQRLLALPSDCLGRYSLGRKVESLYGGMGSFNDNCFTPETEELRQRLYDLCHDVLRDAWKDMGRRTYEVSDEECFRVGDKVRLIPGEVINIGRDEEPDIAPTSPLVYTVSRRDPNDIDNMPVYSIHAGNRWRGARHNALRRQEDAQPQPPAYRR